MSAGLVRLTIDDRPVEVREGATILQAARLLGIDIPALCHLEGYEPPTCCMACVVRVGSAATLVPACATLARDGMRVESETEDVRSARRTALELILSDHVGDCVAPCQRADPRHLDLPRFVRQVAAGDLTAARATLEAAGAVDPDAVDTTRAEHACRRARVDGGVNFALLIRYVVEATTPGPGAGRVPPRYREFSSGMGRPSDEDLEKMLAAAVAAPRLEIAAGGACSFDQACQEAQRCLRCDCRTADDCRLRRYCEAYGAKQTTWHGTRRPFEQRLDHPLIVFESGKCIACGLCVQAAARKGEQIGLTFEQRGFAVRLTVPFGRSLAQALEKSALDCVAVCPTGAFALRDGPAGPVSARAGLLNG